MKILTNVQTSNIGGIGQTFNNLVNYIDKYEKNSINIVGVRITGDHNSAKNDLYKHTKKQSNFELISTNFVYPKFSDIIESSTSLNSVKQAYSPLVDIFTDIIAKESPDLILLSGTYIVPWCLFQAGTKTNIPMVLHYHGILSKEVSHYPSDKVKLVTQMEKTFDNDRLLYLFPSNIAQKAVEEDVFGHKIFKSAVISNSIPDHFFKVKQIGDKKEVGFVGRWSHIKNPDFIEKLANYNHSKKDEFNINVVTNQKKTQESISARSRNNMNLICPMDNRRLADFYGQMGVVITPSFFETYGNVAQEAIASGTPALISSKMGVSETFKKLGLDNWIINFDSVSKVHKILRKVSGQTVDPVVRKKMASFLSLRHINKKLVSLLRSN